MSGQAGIGRTGVRASGVVRRLPFVNVFSKLYPTFIRQWIAFIIGRDEEDDKKACHIQERLLLLTFIMYLSPLSPRFTFWLAFFKVICYLYSSVDCFHIW